MTLGRSTWVKPPLLRDQDRPPQRLYREVSFEGEVSGRAIVKPQKAKPGKRTATKEEREWMDKITAYGCIACLLDGRGFVAPCVHHMLRGGQRIRHLFTLPLCPGHHQDGTGIPGLIARHPHKARFEAKYGTEAELLERLKAALEWTSKYGEKT